MYLLLCVTATLVIKSYLLTLIPLKQNHMGKVSLWVCFQAEARDSLTNIHSGGGRHVAHGRWEKEKRVEALTRIHPGFWSSPVVPE